MESSETSCKKRENSCHRVHHHKNLVFLISLHHLLVCLNVTFSIKAPKKELRAATNRCINKEKEEVFVIPNTNAVTHPGTVMIHPHDTLTAY